MAAAFKCDLCGRLYEDYDGFQYDERGGGHFKKTILSSGAISRDFDTCPTISRDFDTCPNCMRAIIDFMNSRKEQTNGEQ